MNKQSLVCLAAGATLAAAALTPVHAASGNPFEASKLDAGYQVAQADGKKKDGKCGEAKCGGDKKGAATADDKKKDGSCGGKKPEASCGGKK